MADNANLTAGDGTLVAAADEIAGVKYQRIKIVTGADGVNDGDVASANPLPIKITDGTDSVDVVQLGTAVTSSDKGAVTQSVIHGLNSAGGGTYVDVKVNPSGALETNVTGTVAVTGVATAANQSTANTSLSSIDTKLTDGTQKAIASGDVAAGATDSGNPVKVGGIYESTPTTYTNNQRTALHTDSRGNLKVILSPGANVQPFSADNADGAASTATVATPIAVSRNTVFNGSTWDRMYGDTTNGVDVDVTRVVPGTGATNLGKAEDAAHSSGDTGVMALGVRNDAMAALSGTDGDYTPVATTKSGRLLVTPAPSESYVSGNASVAGTGDTSVVAAAGVGLKNYITNISVANTGSSNTLITLKDGNAGSTLFYTIAPAGGGSNIALDVPIVTSANTALYFACGTSSTTVYVSATGYKAP